MNIIGVMERLAAAGADMEAISEWVQENCGGGTVLRSPTNAVYLSTDTFSSQWEIDATAFRSDCGGATVEMTGEHYCGQVAGVGTDQIQRWMTGGADTTTNANQLIAALDEFYQVPAVKKYGVTPDELRRQIDFDRPVILLIRYGDIPMRMDLGWTGGHWIYLAGYETLMWAGTPIPRFLIHDPDWLPRNIGGQRINLMPQGAYLPYIEDMLFEAMDNYGHLAIFTEPPKG